MGTSLGHQRSDHGIRTKGIEDLEPGFRVGLDIQVIDLFGQLERVLQSVIGQGRGPADTLSLVGIDLVEAGHGGRLLEQELRVGGSTHVLDIGKNRGHDVLPSLKALGCQPGCDGKDAVIGGEFPGSGAHAGGQSGLLEQGKHTAGSFVGKYVADQ